MTNARSNDHEVLWLQSMRRPLSHSAHEEVKKKCLCWYQHIKSLPNMSCILTLAYSQYAGAEDLNRETRRRREWAKKKTLLPGAHQFLFIFVINLRSIKIAIGLVRKGLGYLETHKFANWTGDWISHVEEYEGVYTIVLKLAHTLSFICIQTALLWHEHLATVTSVRMGFRWGWIACTMYIEG